MQNAKFEASQSQLRIIDKLELGLREHKTDQGFANDLIREIAKAVGISVEPSEIHKELVSFKREKEEAAERKEREEAAFMEQVIALLSHADAATNSEEAEKVYRDRLLSLGRTVEEEEDIAPLQSFICPLKKDVMIDPVSLSTGTTCEREEIQKWFDSGKKHDPETNELLSDLTLRPNIPIKQSIEEWIERNYCLKIKASKAKLLSGDEERQSDVLIRLQQLCEEKSINKDWIAIEGLIPTIIDVLARTHNKDTKRVALLTLKALVTDNSQNKDKVVDAGGVEQAVRCLPRDSKISKAASGLLLELFYIGSEVNVPVYKKLCEEKSAILLLVTVQNGPVLESSEKAKIMLQELSRDDDNKVQMAVANWYKPLIACLHEGPELSKVKMANAIAEMNLTEQNLKLLGDKGVMVPIVKMLAGNLEAKASALGALGNLSVICDNKKCIAEQGAVPLILECMFSSKFALEIRKKSAKILEILTCNDGTKYLVDGNSDPLELEPIIQNLLFLQQNHSISYHMGRHVINTLLGMISGPNGAVVRKIVRDIHAISFFLSFIENSDKKVRESAIKVIAFLSEEDSNEISEFLLKKEKLNVLFRQLENDSERHLQADIAKILANLPASDDKLNAALIQLEVLPTLMEMLKNSNSEIKESALGALLRFTVPGSVETQQKLVLMGIYPVLVGMLSSGSNPAKERAALAIHNLSLSTPLLSVPPLNKGCFFIFRAKPPACSVHLGPCTVNSTLCLVKSNALSPLVSLLQERDGNVSAAAVKALATLVSKDEILSKGARVLNEVKAIDRLIEMLSNGSKTSKEEALKLLEKLFKLKEIIEAYRSAARNPLVSLASQTTGNASLRKKAVKLLAKLEIGQETSTNF
eukprot:TRINITY_DN9991_c0_g1_i1.p1 TRINITY_DN9991_c0_g1~~TRINITY_DN9991_c0_g1_i1.p1  ORF type:complete len:870 (+),score=209.23 TRINITY_DN9991_c0_g1_i1:1026-3635(+)